MTVTGTGPHNLQLHCDRCGYTEAFTRLITDCPQCGGILMPQYDLEALRGQNWPARVAAREYNLWRYRELLPVRHPETLRPMGEGWTPLVRAERLGATIGLQNLYIKDERQNPTGSFKDRQAAVAIAALVEQGIKSLVLASTGNVAIAYAAFAARMGLELWVFFPRLVPPEKIREAAVYGAHIVQVDGTYDEAKAAAADFAKAQGIFLDKGVKTFAGVESMKTLAFEVAEQLGWRAPDWYIQGVSGGMGPVGVTKGFVELRALGLVDKVPALGLMQSAGCAPMVQAFRQGQAQATPVTDPQTRIATLATGDPGMAYELLYGLIARYGGDMEAATDEEAYAMTKRLAQTEGISVEPATAVAFAALAKLVARGGIAPTATVVINGTGHTYPVEAHIVAESLTSPLALTLA
ncbi:MAG: threonine synthase [Pseudanabaenaceae cyanobacterium]